MLYGYSDGNYFDDTLNTSCNIQQVLIHSNFCINSIQLKYSNGESIYSLVQHGSSDGYLSSFKVPDDQFISHIYLCYGSSIINKYSILQLQFITNIGVSSPLFGNIENGGNCFFLNLNGQLLGIGGYSDKFLNGIFFTSSELKSKIFILNFII